MKIGGRVSITGPMSRNAVAIRADVVEGANKGLLKIAETGEGYVKKQLYRGHGSRTGHLRASIGSGIKKDLVAVVDAGELSQGRDVIYTGWIETGKRRGRQTAFRGYGMFKKATEKIRRLDFNDFLGKQIIDRLG